MIRSQRSGPEIRSISQTTSLSHGRILGAQWGECTLRGLAGQIVRVMPFHPEFRGDPRWKKGGTREVFLRKMSQRGVRGLGFFPAAVSAWATLPTALNPSFCR